ncbi:FliH/SctL family protein [Sanguibacter suaedae]|uniref:Flagellar assembly protein FliH/Type III secretion system HrpE domain-containing protein n=1 Tax=Sanguibacter suaedae TaxID=2795737 RepID=A0A934I3I8_9MICO|nr:FliH/SctL family protein [Sanguibacter suaedae]MBI9114573.1 hypothetical protein [Sanguibacter suaedae]
MSTDTSTQGSHAFGATRLTVVTDGRVRDTQDRARVAGYAEGFAAGSRAAAESTRLLHERLRSEAAAAQAARTAELRGAVAALESAAQAAAARVVPVVDEARELLYSRAFDLARAIVGHELSDTQASARSALARALDVPHEIAVQTVRLNPADLAALTTAGPPAEARGVELVADPTLAPGDAVSTFDGGFLDARVETAFSRALAALAAGPVLTLSHGGAA